MMPARLVALALALGMSACGSGSVARDGRTSAPSVAVTPSASPTSLQPPQSPAALAAYSVGERVWVNVAVATLWTSPSAPRSIDAKAVAAPVDIRGWLGAMSTKARLGLVGRVETQALLGDRLIVTGVRRGWLHVVAVGQPTHRDRRGYPGWVPSRQVTVRAPVAATRVATVVGRATTWLRTSTGRRVMEVSIGTRLPVVSRTTSTVVVALPSHAHLVVASAQVVLRSPKVPALAATASGVVNSARLFLGRPYLWGGRSGFAVDCSGLTELAYGIHGVLLPRDTQDQATAGRAVARTAARLGDLLLFGSGGVMTHVGISLGSGRMLHAPHTGSFVQISAAGRPAAVRRVL